MKIEQTKEITLGACLTVTLPLGVTFLMATARGCGSYQSLLQGSSTPSVAAPQICLYT